MNAAASGEFLLSTMGETEIMSVSPTRAAERRPVTVLGLGAMGSALAGAFVARGHPTTVWNRSPGKGEAVVASGAVRANSVDSAVQSSELVIVCVADYAAMYAILAGVDLTGRTVVNVSAGTTAEAVEASAWVAGSGGEYLGGAILVPPAMIGDDSAVLLFAGSRDSFDAMADAWEALGSTRFLGADPRLVMLYNAALLGFMYAAANGFLHALSLLSTASLPAAGFARFAELAVGWFFPSSVGPLLTAQAAALDEGVSPTAPGADGESMTGHLAEVGNLRETSQENGVSTNVPDFLLDLIKRTIANGHGDAGYLSLVDTLRDSAPIHP